MFYKECINPHQVLYKFSLKHAATLCGDFVYGKLEDNQKVNAKARCQKHPSSMDEIVMKRYITQVNFDKFSFCKSPKQ